MNLNIARATLLLQHHQPEEAVRELRLVLSHEPDNSDAHTLMATALLIQDKLAEAMDEAKQAIASEPTSPSAHAVMARVLAVNGQVDRAMSSINEALRLDPLNPNFFVLAAQLQLQQQRLEQALQATENALKLEPDHVDAINLRSRILLRLGRREEAQAVMKVALQQSPQDEVAHANQGWYEMEYGRNRQALEHFREALRLNPHYNYARYGLIEALKARNIIYRRMLKFFMKLSRLTLNQRNAMMVGLVVVVQLFIRVFSSESGELPPLATAVVIGYFAFVLLTWTSVPLFNLVLRLDRYGRFALDSEQKFESNLVGLCLLIGAILAVGAFFFEGDTRSDLWLAAGQMAAMIMPVSGIFIVDNRNTRLLLATVTVGLIGLIVLQYLTGFGLGLFLLIFVAYAWLASGLSAREQRQRSSPKVIS